jgi:hypothetical protein
MKKLLQKNITIKQSYGKLFHFTEYISRKNQSYIKTKHVIYITLTHHIDLAIEYQASIRYTIIYK